MLLYCLVVLFPQLEREMKIYLVGCYDIECNRTIKAFKSKTDAEIFKLELETEHNRVRFFFNHYEKEIDAEQVDYPQNLYDKHDDGSISFEYFIDEMEVE
jgi:hypothetical protein